MKYVERKFTQESGLVLFAAFFLIMVKLTSYTAVRVSGDSMSICTMDPTLVRAYTF